MRIARLLWLPLAAATFFIHAQAPAPARPTAAKEQMTIEDYEPKTVLVVPEHHPTRAKFPFIDVHTHHRDTSQKAVAILQKDMDAMNMQIMVNSPVNGSWGDKTKELIDGFRTFNKDRFVTFTNINFKGIGEPDWASKTAAQLETDIKNGAVGLKVWKNFGLTEKDIDGKRVAVDDARLDAIWDMCAKYKIPVLIHTADPKPLFQPMDKNNERWLELKLQPNRGSQTIPWDQLIGEQHNLIRRHPKTNFIAAHLGWMSHDLDAMGKLLDEMPNFNVDIAAILGEIGRQPRQARKFFIKYQNRILFGKDRYDPAEYGFYFRILETEDEYFDNIRKYHGLWKLYGLALPDETLKHIYYKNALRLVPGLKSSGFPR